MQLACMADGGPLRLLGGQDDLAGLVHLRLAGGHGLQDRAYLVGVNAPHAGVTELACGFLCGQANGFGAFEFSDHTVRRHFAVGVTSAGDFQLGAHHQRVGKLALYSHAIGRNCAGMGRDKVHQTKTDGLHTWMGGNFKCAVHGRRRFNQHMQRHIGRMRLGQCGLCAVHIVDRLDLGHHDVRQHATGRARNLGHVGIKTRVVHRVDTNSNASTRRFVFRCEGHFSDHHGVIGFAANRGAVFTVEGDIKNASSKLLRHVGLQLQAFEHPRVNAAVMVTHRKLNACGLCTQQDVARMAH